MNFLRFILLLVISVSIFCFVTFLNVKILFATPDTANKMLNESNIYPMAAAGIRDNIVKYADVPVSQNNLIEIVNAAITEDNIKGFAEDFVNQFFIAIKAKDGKPKITIHFSILRDEVNTRIASDKELSKALELSPDININNILADRDVDLSTNPYVMILVNINKFLIGFGAAAIIAIILLMLSGTWSQKLSWLGATLIVSSLAFVGELAIYFFGMSEKTLDKLAKLSKMEDEKFLLGIRKLIVLLVDYEKTYYLVVTILLIVLGVVLLIIGKSIKNRDLNMEGFRVQPEALKPATIPTPGGTPLK